MIEPLAIRVRPQKLDDIKGQSHLIGENGILSKMIENKRLFSLIFYGPPGTGKTTLATVIANQLEIPYRNFNAVTGNKKDLEAIFLEAKLSKGLIVIIDEVHRLNKDKQDLLLPHIEDGSIIMLAATTANPFFSINPAIRSRCHLLEVKPLKDEDLKAVILRALNSKDGLDNKYSISDKAINLIINKSGGDVRFALNLLDICALASNGDIYEDIVIKYGNVKNSGIDKDGDGHYDALSAFQKSIRGSDVNAALYYLARLIQANDMDSIERRLLVTAYEDIGLANPAAVNRCIAAIDTAKRVGFPEASIPLSFTVIDLALSPKSKSACKAIHSAINLVNNHSYQVPNYLKLTPVNLTDEEKYPYDLHHLWPYIQYLPDEIKDQLFYKPALSGNYEKQLADNYKKLLKINKSNDLKFLKKNIK